MRELTLVLLLSAGCIQTGDDDPEGCTCDTSFDCSKNCKCDPECATGSGSDAGVSPCVAMCSHVYQECGFAISNPNGGQESEASCTASCASWYSPSEISCVETATCTEAGLNSCFGASTPIDDGAWGSACMCTSSPTVDPIYGMFCSGTEDGCAGIGLTGELGCFAQRRTGAGTCVYRCSSGDIGYQGACPSGYQCVEAGSLDSADHYWPVCIPN